MGYAVKINSDGQLSDLPIRRDITDHAPAFAWGYRMVGSVKSKAQVEGASQLALALCAHALDNDGLAQLLHQRFKNRFMANFESDAAWSITAEEIAQICDQIRDAEASPTDRAAIASEVVAVDREPAVGKVSTTTSSGHVNEIPHARNEEVKDDDA